ncbi:MAG: hypothetical protein M1812_001011 [Candelaria pacifica]|nr:MAG: hypothetical protein M1812_001011 [Candelaria pacifica]
MTDSIPIPRRQKQSAASSSSNSSLNSTSPQNPAQKSLNPSSPTAQAASVAPSSSHHHERRVSLLSSSISKQEHTVINVGHPDGPPRLITCVKASQGFDWNQDIFLPSYADHESGALERKKDPVHEIVLTDEEIKDLFPQ